MADIADHIRNMIGVCIRMIHIFRLIYLKSEPVFNCNLIHGNSIVLFKIAAYKFATFDFAGFFSLSEIRPVLLTVSYVQLA